MSDGPKGGKKNFTWNYVSLHFWLQGWVGGLMTGTQHIRTHLYFCHCVISDSVTCVCLAENTVRGFKGQLEACKGSFCASKCLL